MLDAKGHGQRSCSKHELSLLLKGKPKPNIQNVTQTMHFNSFLTIHGINSLPYIKHNFHPAGPAAN